MRARNKVTIFFSLVIIVAISIFMHQEFGTISKIKQVREEKLAHIISLWNVSDYNALIGEAEKYLQHYPNDSSVRILYGISFLNSAELGVEHAYQKDTQELWNAIYEIRRALVIDPNNKYKDEAQYMLGKAYYFLEGAQLNKAIKYLQASVTSDIKAADLYDFLVAAYKAQKDYNKAIALIKDIIAHPLKQEKVQSISNMRLHLIDMLFDINDVSGAEKEILSGLQNNDITEQEKNAFTIRQARVLLAHSKINNAIMFLSDIIKRDPQSFEALYYLGIAYNEKGEAGKARYYWRQSLAINPYWDKVLEKLK